MPLPAPGASNVVMVWAVAGMAATGNVRASKARVSSLSLDSGCVCRKIPFIYVSLLKKKIRSQEVSGSFRVAHLRRRLLWSAAPFTALLRVVPSQTNGESESRWHDYL